ncbi:cupin domain-containing protein [Phenylobacterium sp.]|uniref:cupin domain-containing protein n=1 Tax=Phenylobacterium sp. TaxID=1871053 RepID=UPI0035B3BA20
MPDLISRADSQMVWVPHPRFPGVRFSWLMEKARGEAPFDCALVRMSPAAEVFEHVHETESDVLYVLSGAAVMSVAGVGDIPLRRGAFLRIPPGVAHRPHSFTDDFTLFNFWPATPA